MRSSHGTSGGRGTCGPLSMCHRRPPCSLSCGSWRHAVLAMTWQSSPSSGSMTSRRAGLATRPLHDLAPIQHLVAERLPVLGPVPVAALVGRHLVVDPLDVGDEFGHLAGTEQTAQQREAVPLQLLAGLGDRLGGDGQVTGSARDHAPSLASNRTAMSSWPSARARSAADCPSSLRMAALAPYSNSRSISSTSALSAASCSAV